MCGYIVSTEDIILIQSYLASTHYRGPDASIAKSINNISFGFNRLAFQGVNQAGMQPMQYGDRWTIVYNGEIYNTGELEKILSNFGRTFKNVSGSDTEILLAFLVFCADADMFHLLSRIDGIYSFVLYDALLGDIYFCNDEFGVKPQFFLIESNHFIICSDLSFFRNFETNSVDVFRKYIKSPQSLSPTDLYKGFSESEAGTMYKFNTRNSELRLIQKGKFKFTSKWTYLKNIIKIGSKIHEAVRLNSVGDYPICYLLSGGVDSSLISLCAERHLGKSKKNDCKIDTFSIEFSDDPYSEKAYRQKVLLKKPELTGNEITVDANNYITSLVDYINKSRRLPVIANEIALYILFKSVSASGYRVAISGEGADEIFDGYHYIRDAAITNCILRLSSLPIIGSYLNSFLISRSDRFKRYLLNPSCLLAHITDDDSYINKVNGRYKIDDIKEIMIRKYLRGLLYRADNASMLNSIELRVPFLSKAIVYLYNVRPFHFGAIFLSPKILLKSLLATKLGYRFAFSKKRGFAVPWASWYATSCQFRNIWNRTKSDPLINSLALIPEGIESNVGFNDFFENTGFRLMCIFIYKSNGNDT